MVACASACASQRVCVRECAWVRVRVCVRACVGDAGRDEVGEQGEQGVPPLPRSRAARPLLATPTHPVIQRLHSREGGEGEGGKEAGRL